MVVAYIKIYIAYTEQKENHGSMILHGASYSADIVLCRIISSDMVEPSCSPSSFDEYCLICRVFSSLGVSRRPCVSSSMLRCQYIFLKFLDLPSGEGVSTH